MRVRVGTSGYSYTEWKGGFYPADLKPAEMLRFYASRLPAVEINNTFYRMPARGVLETWREETPEGFTFVLKAPQRITHQKRLGDVGDPLSYFLDVVSTLASRLGPVLYQLPPYFTKDLDRLRAFLERLPARPGAAFEFRHPSWSDPEVATLLRAHGAALCVADTEEEAAPPEILATARFGYLRLRRPDYDAAALQAWVERVRAQDWDEAYVFFKHEDARGPQLAAQLMQALG